MDPIDPWEMDAAAEEARFAAGSYIDIFAVDLEARGSFAIEEGWVRRLAESLRHRELRCARTDFVLRHAEIDGVSGFGVTWFVEGCGRVRFPPRPPCRIDHLRNSDTPIRGSCLIGTPPRSISTCSVARKDLWMR
jgi:hypothetical protein